MTSELCAEELETLLAIFLDEIQVVNDESGKVMVTMVLFPSTGDDSESKYVTFTLELLLPKEYPDVVPVIKFRNPRGLSEEKLSSLAIRMKEKCEELAGCSMIFELIDMGKEFLTSHNLPASECPICLLSFTESDIFFVPSCFHHVHSFCLGKYLYSVRQSWADEDHLPNETASKHSCPVCRLEFIEEIDIDVFLAAAPPTQESEESLEEPLYTQSWYKEWSDKKEKFDRLFAKQKEKGGIIDLSGKDIKLLVISSPSPAPPQNTSETADTLEETASSLPQQSSDIPNSRNSKSKSQQPQQQQQQTSKTNSSSTSSSTTSNTNTSTTCSKSSSTERRHKDTRGGSHYRHRRRK